LSGVTNKTRLSAGFAVALVLAVPPVVRAQIAAQVPPDIKPAWDKGIQKINPTSYYNAIECGKQGGSRPACIFYDGDVCRNDDFTLALFTPYKQVAYEVWQTVKAKKPTPQPDYQAAERTRVTIGITPIAAAKNPITTVTITRGERVTKPVAQTMEAGGGGKFVFDFPAFAPTGDITIQMAGKTRTVTCLVSQPVLTLLR
jgi:hypothetical protein